MALNLKPWELVDKLRLHNPELRVTILSKDGGTRWLDPWSMARSLRDKVNARTLLSDEVVLDIDGNNAQSRVAKLKQITAALKQAGYSYESWFSGSRGYHIHLKFPELSNMTEQQRKKARLWFIRKYGCDEAKQSGLIALERAAHFKSGELKTILSKSERGNNKVPAECIEFALKNPSYSPKRTQGLTISKNQLREHPLVVYCLTHEIPDGHKRHSVWLKNLGALYCNAKLTDQEVLELGHEMAQNFVGKSSVPDELLNWTKWFRAREVSNG